MAHITPTYELIVFAADDVTPLFDVSTDPAHARPFLKAPTHFPEQEVDFAKGAASIGQANITVVDVPTDPTDQDTGYLTSVLSDADGLTQLLGRRALLTEDVGGGPETVLDGVVSTATLLDTFASFELELMDIRERERKTRAFERTDTPTLLPRGVLGGYGVVYPWPFVGPKAFPVPPTEPLRGRYSSWGSGFGRIEFSGQETSDPERVLTPPMAEAFESIAPLEGSPHVLVFDRWKLRWRPSTGGSYTTIEHVAHRHASLPGGGGQPPYDAPQRESGDRIIMALLVNNVVDGGTLPSDGQLVDVIVQYDGPVTEDWLLHVQGMTVGEFIQKCYDGDYSEEDPRIRYDEAAVLALKTPIRARIKEPVDDLRDYLEKNAYPIAHAAPTLNAAGEISPVTYLLPDASETLPHLDDDNCAPAGAGWAHGTQDAINLVRCDYVREYRVSERYRTGLALSDQIKEFEVPLDVPHEASIALLGERKLEISSELLRAIGTENGGPLTGDVMDETGAQVAARVGRMALDRFVFGGQYFQLRGLRSDPAIQEATQGAWVTVGVSWMPDYLSHERGLSRLAQVVRRRSLDAAWCHLTLIDAGSAEAPLFAPTLGTVTAALNGVVSISVSALGTGDPDARVDYAVSTLEPAEDSELWRFLARIDAPGTVTTPPVAPGSTVWARARSELPGRRPSVWTSAVSVAVPTVARIISGQLSVNVAGTPAVQWVPNQYCAGVRIHYDEHAQDEVPTFPDSVDVDAGDLAHVLAAVTVGRKRQITVQLEPFTGWTGAAVSGTAGPVLELVAVRPPVAELIRPEIDVAARRSGDDVTIDLFVTDPQLRVLAIEYRQKEGLDAGDTLDASWNTWSATGGSGTPGIDTEFVRTHDMTVQGGREGEFLWRVRWTGDEGEVITADSFVPSNLEEEEKTVVVDHFAMIEFDEGHVPPKWEHDHVFFRSANCVLRGTVQPIPVGSEIIGFRVRAANEDASPALLTITLVRVQANDTQGPIGGTLDWIDEDTSWKEDTTIGVVAADEESFHMIVQGDSIATAGNCRFYRAEITYLAPAYRFTI